MSSLRVNPKFTIGVFNDVFVDFIRIFVCICINALARIVSAYAGHGIFRTVHFSVNIQHKKTFSSLFKEPKKKWKEQLKFNYILLIAVMDFDS